MMQPSIEFNWQAPTTRVDGSALSQADIAALSYVLFESGEPILRDIGELNYTLLMDDQPQGQKAYTVAAEQYGLTGPQTEPVTINFTAPAAPEEFTASWKQS